MGLLWRWRVSRWGCCGGGGFRSRSSDGGYRRCNSGAGQRSTHRGVCSGGRRRYKAVNGVLGCEEEEEEERGKGGCRGADRMDFSQLTDAMASRSYDKVADVCDQLMLQIASQGVAFQDEWPYAVHLLGHIYLNDLNSARFLWKSVPNSVKESRPEVAAVWKIGQQLWVRNYAERYTRRMLELLMSAYSTISIQDTALFLGMNENDATNYVMQQGWSVDVASKMLTVKKQVIVTEQKIDPSKLQRLTEYVFHLEH
ncbi:hypothetical protein LXL04_016846 [Taraxacum kok-saghyz]